MTIAQEAGRIGGQQRVQDIGGAALGAIARNGKWRKALATVDAAHPGLSDADRIQRAKALLDQQLAKARLAKAKKRGNVVTFKEAKHA